MLISLNARVRFKVIKVTFQNVRIFEIRVHELLLAIEVRINKHSKSNNVINNGI